VRFPDWRYSDWRLWLLAGITAALVQLGWTWAYRATWPPWPQAVHQEGVQAGVLP
jgi:hypothetical protein